MSKFACVLATAAIMTACVAGPTQAASVTVLTDSGDIGAFTFTNSGVGGGGTATISVSVPSVTAAINTVNGVIVAPEPAKVNTPTTFLVTPAGANAYNVSIPGGNAKTVGSTVGQQAIMPFNLTTGATNATLPNFFNVSGPITSVAANLNPTYDFSAFANGLGKINITFTATSFTGAGVSSFASFFTTPGATAVGNGSFSQISAVPEPASVVSMGVGMIGLAMMGVIRKRIRAMKA